MYVMFMFIPPLPFTISYSLLFGALLFPTSCLFELLHLIKVVCMNMSVELLTEEKWLPIFQQSLTANNSTSARGGPHGPQSHGSVGLPHPLEDWAPRCEPPQSIDFIVVVLLFETGLLEPRLTLNLLCS